jgi:enoyl-CoA hydratase/carnithine racemase
VSYDRYSVRHERQEKMSYDGIQSIRVEVGEGVATATIDSPPINLLDLPLIASLDALVRAVEADDDVRVLVLRSADPDFFVAHGDLEMIIEMPSDPPPPRREGANDAPGLVHPTLERFRLMPKVTIAQVEGQARAGGSELTLACDMRFAAIGRAVFGQPEIGLGILPSAGGTVRLARLVGRARASEIILGGEDVSAEEAERLGWVNRALPADELGAYVDRLARRIATFSAPAIAGVKAVIAEVERGTPGQLAAEEHAFRVLMAGPEPRSLMRAALAAGWQTREGEPEIGARLGELGKPV